MIDSLLNVRIGVMEAEMDVESPGSTGGQVKSRGGGVEPAGDGAREGGREETLKGSGDGGKEGQGRLE